MQVTRLTPSVVAELVSKMSQEELVQFTDTLFQKSEDISYMVSRDLEILAMDKHYCENIPEYA